MMFLIIACRSEKIAVIRNKLPLPHEPIYPQIKFVKNSRGHIVINNPKMLLERQILVRGYIDELRAVIIENNRKVKPNIVR